MQDHSSRRVYACLAFPYPNKSRQTTPTAACREGSAGRKIALGQGRCFAAQCLSTSFQHGVHGRRRDIVRSAVAGPSDSSYTPLVRDERDLGLPYGPLKNIAT